MRRFLAIKEIHDMIPLAEDDTIKSLVDEMLIKLV
jgi:hypothetical protein